MKQLAMLTVNKDGKKKEEEEKGKRRKGTKGWVEERGRWRKEVGLKEKQIKKEEKRNGERKEK